MNKNRPVLSNKADLIDYCQLASFKAIQHNLNAYNYNLRFKNAINSSLKDLSEDYPYLDGGFLTSVALELLKNSPYLDKSNFKTRFADTVRFVSNDFKYEEHGNADCLDLVLSELSIEDREKYESLDGKVKDKLRNAIENVDSKKVRDHISNNSINLRREVFECLRGMLNNSSAYATLQSMPKAMTFRLSFAMHTPFEIKRQVNDEVHALALRSRLLLHIAKTSNQMQETFGISLHDIQSFYGNQIKKGQTHKYKKQKRSRKKNGIRSYNGECSVSQRIKNILTKSITIDHIEEIKTWGADLALKKIVDPVFGEEVCAPNSAKNLYVMPRSLNLRKTEFIQSQVDIKKVNCCGRLFFNLVPAKGTKDGCFMYPYAKAYEYKEDVKPHVNKHTPDGGKNHGDKVHVKSSGQIKPSRVGEIIVI